MNKCVYETNMYKCGCLVLTEKVCNKRECSFYKSSKDYRLDCEGIAVKRSDNNGNTSFNNR